MKCRGKCKTGKERTVSHFLCRTYFSPISIDSVNPSLSTIVCQMFRKCLNWICIFRYQEVWHFFSMTCFIYLFMYEFDLLGTMLVRFYAFGNLLFNTPIYLTLFLVTFLTAWWPLKSTQIGYSFTSRCFFFLFFFLQLFCLRTSQQFSHDHSESFDKHRTISTFLKFAPVLSSGGRGGRFRYS